MEMVIDIPEEQAKLLEHVSTIRNKSKEELVQSVVSTFLGSSRNDPEPELSPLDFFGIWKDFPEDGQVFQDRMRKEWVREWDPEYTAE